MLSFLESSVRVADAAFPQDIQCTYTPSGQHIESCTAKYIFGTPGPNASTPLEARVIAPQDQKSVKTSMVRSCHANDLSHFPG